MGDISVYTLQHAPGMGHESMGGWCDPLHNAEKEPFEITCEGHKS